MSSLLDESRVVDGVTYVMEHTRHPGALWRGGLVGGDIASPSGRCGAFSEAAAPGAGVGVGELLGGPRLCPRRPNLTVVRRLKPPCADGGAELHGRLRNRSEARACYLGIGDHLLLLR